MSFSDQRLNSMHPRRTARQLNPWRPSQRPYWRPSLRTVALAVLVLFAGDVCARDLSGLGSTFRYAPRFQVQEFQLELTNGDEADLYAPRVPPRRRGRTMDAFGMVAVLQGALVDKSQYRALGRELARQGLVVVVPNHFRGFPGFPFPVLFSEVEVVTAVYETLLLENADAQSPLADLIDTERMGIVGHSLGGRVGLEAIAGVCSVNLCSGYATDTDGDGLDDNGFEPPPVDLAGAFYGTNLVNFFGGIDDLDTSMAPVALVQGSLDGVSTPAEALASYPNLEQPRALITVHGANHYGITEDIEPPGANPDPLLPTLNQRIANLVIARWTGHWLRAQLLDDPRAQFWIYGAGGGFSGIVDVTTD